MPVSINISNQNIKLVYSRGNTVEKWETAPLNPWLVKDGQILEPQTVSNELNTLFEKLRWPRNQVIASINGIPFVYRILVLPCLKTTLLREAVERSFQKEINVSLNELYFDWQIVSNTGNEMEVFVLGVPRGLIDELIHTLEQANLRLTSLDLKSLALTRLVDIDNALIVDFEKDWSDIIIISKGIPVALHALSAKSQTANLEDAILQLVDEITRTVEFFNITHKENPILSDIPILLSGSLAAEPATRDLIQNSTGHPVQPLIANLELPADFPSFDYACNLGLISKNARSFGSPKHSLEKYPHISSNLLTGRRRIRTNPVSLKQIGVFTVVIVITILVALFSIMKAQTVSEAAKLQTELSRINHSLYVGRLALDETASLEENIAKLTSETRKIREEHEIIAGKGKMDLILQSITSSLPDNARFTGIRSDAREITIDGKADSRQDVINYADRQAKSGQFSEVRIALIDETKEAAVSENLPGINFEVIIER